VPTDGLRPPDPALEATLKGDPDFDLNTTFDVPAFLRRQDA
jgi:hypothetical protein